MNILVVSGGSGNDSLIKGLNKLYPKADIKILLNAYDSGKSTGICRKVTNTLGVSDIRKNQSRQYKLKKDYKENVYDFLEGRFDFSSYPKTRTEVLNKLKELKVDTFLFFSAIHRFFDIIEENENFKNLKFKNFNIANIIYSVLFKEYGYEQAVSIMSNFLDIPNNIVFNSYDNVYIMAKTKSGKILSDEGDIVKYSNDIDLIEKIYYQCSDVCSLNDKAIKSIEDADVIIVSSGTFWSSIYPTLDYVSLYKHINISKAKKIWVMNNEQDQDSLGVTSNDFIDILNNLGLDMSQFIILENNDACTDLKLYSKNYEKNIVRKSMGNIDGKHDPIKLAYSIFEIIFNEYLNLFMIFDFDDTIWSRDFEKDEDALKTSIENLRFVNELYKINNKELIISGNSHKSIEEKIKKYIDFLVEIPIIADANSVLYTNGTRKVLDESFIIDEHDLNFLKNYLKNYNCSTNDGHTFFKIKPVYDKRNELCDLLNNLIQLYLIAKCTGRTTIDVMTKANSKSKALSLLIDDFEKYCYVGDELIEGNDSDILNSKTIKCLNIKDIYETNVFLKTQMRRVFI